MDPMILISLASGLFFAFVGNWMARRRGAHTTLWTLLGFLFPPFLIILKLIHWTPVPRDEDDGDENGGIDDDGNTEGGPDDPPRPSGMGQPGA